MNIALVRKCLQESKWLLAACGAAMLAFCWLRVWIVSRMDTGRFKAILDLLPDDWQRFTPVDFDWLITYQGRIALAYDEFIVIMCVTIWAIARGSAAVSGELARGTMEMLLAQPLARLHVLLTHASVTICGVAILAASAWLGTWLGIVTSSVEEQVRPSWDLPIPLPYIGSELPVPFSQPVAQRVPMVDKVDPALFVPASVNLFALGFMVAGFATLMSSWDRYRWRTIGIVVGVLVVQVIVKLWGMAADEWSWLLYFSALTAYEPEAFVRVADETPAVVWNLFQVTESGRWIGYGPLWYHLLMAAIGTVSYVAAAVIFWRRDLPAPL